MINEKEYIGLLLSKYRTYISNIEYYLHNNITPYDQSDKVEALRRRIRDYEEVIRDLTVISK